MRVILYLGIGVFLHIMFIGTTFNSANLLGWLLLLMWPLPFVVAVFLAAFFVLLVVILVVGIWGWIENRPFMIRRHERQLRRMFDN
jgi:hypothetical protein